MVSERETVDKNGVHIAERLIVPNEYRLITGYNSTDINYKIQTINENGGVFGENINTTIYVNLLIGYDWQTMTIVIIQIDAELSGYSKIFVFTKQDILKAKYSWFSDTFQIYDKSDSLIKNILTFLSSKNRTIFVINAESDTTLTDNEGKLILVYMKQTEEKEDFVKFFKEFAIERCRTRCYTIKRVEIKGTIEMNENDIKILAIVGMSGSGKSVVVDYLTEKGYPKVYFGGMIYKEMNRRGIERTADGESEKRFREMIRETEGKDWVVKQVIDETKNLIKAGQKRIVLDGLYSWTEYKALKREFPGQLTVLAVVVPKALRHFRVGKRPERPFNTKEIQERDRSEIENLEKGGPIAMADFYVLNDDTVAKLHDDVDKILRRIEF